MTLNSWVIAFACVGVVCVSLTAVVLLLAGISAAIDRIAGTGPRVVTRAAPAPMTPLDVTQYSRETQQIIYDAVLNDRINAELAGRLDDGDHTTNH